MIVTLIGKNGQKLAEKRTEGKFGEPFLAEDKNNIVVPFDFVDNVNKIKISFDDGEHGQIRTLIVQGYSGLNFSIFTFVNNQNSTLFRTVSVVYNCLFDNFF